MVSVRVFIGVGVTFVLLVSVKIRARLTRADFKVGA